MTTTAPEFTNAMRVISYLYCLFRPKVDMAEAMFDYAPQHVGDLALKVGDKVEVSRKGDDGWWSGTLRGQQGNFPGDFIRLRHYPLRSSRNLCLGFLLVFAFL